MRGRKWKTLFILRRFSHVTPSTGILSHPINVLSQVSKSTGRWLRHEDLTDVLESGLNPIIDNQGILSYDYIRPCLTLPSWLT